MQTGENRLTALLQRWNQGDASAAQSVVPLVYDDMRELARRYLRHERPNHTLQQTALVHEVYLRLLEQRVPKWQHRADFLASAAVLMRRILTDHARRRSAAKRADGSRALPLDAAPLIVRPGPDGVRAMADALADLDTFDRQKSRIVNLRFFWGLSMEEIADALGISVRTAHREWTVARAWLHAYMSDRA